MATQEGDLGSGSVGLATSSSNTGSTGTSGNTGTDANVPGAAPRSGAESGTDGPNFGSARSDYGDRAYGGSLNEQGTGGKSIDDFSQGRRDVGSSGYSRLRQRMTGGGGGAGSGLMLLYGIGIGAALMYILDPQQGRRRRALLRDKLIALSNDVSDTVGKTSRDLRNRAQGVVAEASSMIGLQGQTDEQQSGEQQSSAAGGSLQ